MNNTKNMNPYTAILVDDAEPARELIRLMLNELAPHIRIAGEAENLHQAVALIRKVKPDIVFLDIQMPGKLGLELFTELDQEEANCEVIFTTAYNEYAIQAFKLSAIDYLLKPIQEHELQEAVAKACKAKEQKHHAEKYTALLANLQPKRNGTLAIPLQHGCEYLAVNDIEFVEADRAYSIIHLNDGSQKLVSKNMGYFEDLLQHFDTFIKPHRSYFVNLYHIATFQKKGEAGILTFKSGNEVEVSRNYRKTLIERLEQYKQ